MTKGPSKQRSIRLGGDLDQKVEELAKQEDLPFSLVVKRLLRQALAQKAYAQHSQHQAA
jgi:predicted transcriptional regulator